MNKIVTVIWWDTRNGVRAWNLFVCKPDELEVARGACRAAGICTGVVKKEP